MSQEVFQMICKMDLKKLENQLALQCAPLIMGKKVSNLLIVDAAEEGLVRAVMHNTGISVFRLLQHQDKITFLLFRRKELEVCLNRKEVKDFLVGQGYSELSLGKILLDFKTRYDEYMKKGEHFPHEMGLLLGYPVEDVRGFMENKGEKFLYSGYWKVYANLPAKLRLFEQYEQAREEMIQQIAGGTDIRALIYNSHEQMLRKAV